MRLPRHGPKVRGPVPLISHLSTNFDGSTEYAYKSLPSYIGDLSGAICYRFKIATLLGANGSQPVFGGGSTSGSNDVVFIAGVRRRDATASGVSRLALTLRTTSGGAVIGIMGSTNLAAGTWYSAVVQSDGSDYSMYLNGVAETLTFWAGSDTGDWLGDVVHSGTFRNTFGASYGSGAATGFWGGNIDEAIYVNRNLTAAEVTEFHNSGRPKDWWERTFAKDIRGAWHMGEGDDDSGIYDRSGNSNDLTLVNIASADYVADVP